MKEQVIRISYDGPFRELTTAPTSFTMTVRDLCPDAKQNEKIVERLTSVIPSKEAPKKDPHS